MFVFSKGCPWIFALKIRIVTYSIFDVKIAKKEKREKIFGSKF
jgi:hypothetical protein